MYVFIQLAAGVCLAIFLFLGICECKMRWHKHKLRSLDAQFNAINRMKDNARDLSDWGNVRILAMALNLLYQKAYLVQNSRQESGWEANPMSFQIWALRVRIAEAFEQQRFSNICAMEVRLLYGIGFFVTTKEGIQARISEYVDSAGRPFVMGIILAGEEAALHVRGHEKAEAVELPQRAYALRREIIRHALGKTKTSRLSLECRNALQTAHDGCVPFKFYGTLAETAPLLSEMAAMLLPALQASAFKE